MMKYLYLCLGFFLVACAKGEMETEGLPPTSLSVPDTPLTIRDETQLIGGPSAQGRLGDVLLSNDKIRVIIQKPSKNAGIGSFGGTIIDADHAGRSAGMDQWGELFPMVNVEWTVNYISYEVPAGMEGQEGGPQVLIARGMIDVYEYLDLDWIADAAAAVLKQQVAFADRFDDLRDPFRVNEELADLSLQVTTEYRLDPGNNYMKIDTTFINPSDHPISLPIGDFLVGSGELQLLIPGIGFAPSPSEQLSNQTPAVIYAGFDGGDVSYGYFYDPKPFGDDKTTSLSYSGLTGVLLGEEFLKILPIGSNATPEIHFQLPPASEKTITRYFVVGDGSAGSVLDTGLKILQVQTAPIFGQVVLSSGAPAAQTLVAVKKVGGGTVVTYRTDASGQFQGLLPTGADRISQMFGEGKYEVQVEKKGYHEKETTRAGNCQPSQIDVSAGVPAEVRCTLGESGLVQIAQGVIDKETGSKIPARLTIIGTDPSPETKGAGTFSDLDIFKKPFGIVDVHFVSAKGGLDLTDQTTFELEPGNYRVVFSHGPEYSIVERDITVSAGSTATIEEVVLKRLVTTHGFVSADFHIHALPSPDSHFSVEHRALAAAADGLDVLQSSDHDFLTDYGPVVLKLSEEGILAWDSIQTIVGDEITPNHYGHLHAFPLTVDLADPDHGALDWSATPSDEISPAPDTVMSPVQIIKEVLKDPGEEVVQINHISDNPTGLPVATGWLTTPIYEEEFGTRAFSAYADPVERRLAAQANKPPLPPYGMETNELIFDTFTAVELAIGSSMKETRLWDSTLPTWFNLLNLGLMPTATGNSDSHHEIGIPLGMPRNYVASAVDPRDGLGDSFTMIDEEAYARNINDRKVIVSAGPFISVEAINEAGDRAQVGDWISGGKIELDILVEAPEWAWFDTIEVYMNTEPVPAEDSGRFALRGEAADPASFAKPYHVPRYVYTPEESFKLIDGTLRDWSMEDGKIQARLKLGINVNEDTWVVIVAKGTAQTEGYRSLFPIVPDVLMDEEEVPTVFDPQNLAPFHSDRNVGAPAWAFTNPIFIDVDGDTDGDGFPFEAKWVRSGLSHLKPFEQ